MIDNRILLPFIAPAVIIGYFRLVYWVLGAGWRSDHAVAAYAAIFALFAAIAVQLGQDGKTIGRTRIWRRK